MRHELSDLAVLIADARQRSSSTIATVGGYVVVVATALPARAVTLTSCYVGQIDGDAAATHLLLAPQSRALLAQRVLQGLQPGATHARACLLDHAAELQHALSRAGDSAVRIDVGPVALTRAAAAWQDDDTA